MGSCSFFNKSNTFGGRYHQLWIHDGRKQSLIPLSGPSFPSCIPHGLTVGGFLSLCPNSIPHKMPQSGMSALVEYDESLKFRGHPFIMGRIQHHDGFPVG